MTASDPTEKSRREALRNALAAVAKEPARPSLTAELYALLDDIERAMSSGASLEEVRQALAKQGLSSTPAGFNSALYRARQRRAKGQGPSSTGSRTTAAPQPAAGSAKGKSAKPGDYRIPELEKFRHNPSADEDVFQ